MHTKKVKLDLRSLGRLQLSPGVYRLPSYFTRNEIEGTAELIADLILDARAREITDKAPQVARASLAPSKIVGWIDGEGNQGVLADEAKGGAYIVIARGSETSATWLERYVKPEVVAALRRFKPTIPNGSELILQASAFTNDPLELLILLERAIDHASKAAPSPSDETFRHSLRDAAAARLIQRLSRLEGEALPSAVALVLAEGRGDSFDPTFRQGAEALDRVGLALFRNGDLALGPLARAAAEGGPIREAFITNLPARAWSARAAEATQSAMPKLEQSVAMIGVRHDRDESVVGPPARVDVVILVAGETPHAELLKGLGLSSDDAAYWAKGMMPPIRPRFPPFTVGPRPNANGGSYWIRILRIDARGGFGGGPPIGAFVRRTWDPRIIATCGLCAGAKEVEIGDVVIADAIVRYDFLGSDAETATVSASTRYRLNPRWATRILNFEQVTGSGKNVHLGTIATGSRVLRAPDALRHSAVEGRGSLAYEVDTETIDAVAEERNALIVCGVSTRIGSEAAGVSREAEAARAAAEWLVRFLDNHLADL